MSGISTKIFSILLLLSVTFQLQINNFVSGNNEVNENLQYQSLIRTYRKLERIIHFLEELENRKISIIQSKTFSSFIYFFL